MSLKRNLKRNFQESNTFSSSSSSSSTTNNAAFKVPTLPNAKRSNSASAQMERLLESAEPIAALSSSDVKQRVVALERAATANTSARAQYGAQPKRFMASEVELDERLQSLADVALDARLYAVLVKLRVAETLCALLTHENADIGNDCASVLRELCDVGVLYEARSVTLPFVDQLIDAQVLPMLVAHLERVVVREASASDAAGAESVLAVVESLAEVRPGVCDALLRDTPLASVLLRRLAELARTGAAGAQQVHLYAAELLSIVLQQCAEATLRECVTAEHMEQILMALATFRLERKRERSETRELAANLFNVLCSVLLRGAARARQFLIESDGIALLLLLARSIPAAASANADGVKYKRSASTRRAALRALEYAVMSSLVGAANFIDSQGLGLLCKCLTSKRRGKKLSADEAEVPVRAAMLLAALLRVLHGFDADESGVAGELDVVYTQRVAAKALEAEKLAALVALHQSLHAAVSEADTKIAVAMRVLQLRNKVISEELEDQWYSERLEAGLFELQQVDLSLALLASSDRARVQQALRKANVDATLLAEIITQFAEEAAATEDDQVLQTALAALLAADAQPQDAAAAQ